MFSNNGQNSFGPNLLSGLSGLFSKSSSGSPSQGIPFMGGEPQFPAPPGTPTPEPGGGTPPPQGSHFPWLSGLFDKIGGFTDKLFSTFGPGGGGAQQFGQNLGQAGQQFGTSLFDFLTKTRN